jgi:hypothetical protein
MYLNDVIVGQKTAADVEELLRATPGALLIRFLSY